MVEDEEFIRRNLTRVQERIAAAATSVGRSSEEVSLVAVSKGQSAWRVAAAYRAGALCFGESRVQEAQAKVAAVAGLLTAEASTAVPHLQPPLWHLIGHLQTNKVRAAVSTFSMVHSVDSLRLAEALDREAGRQALGVDRAPLPVLLQVNVSGEASKHGFSPRRLLLESAHVLDLPGLRLHGLMTIAPLADSPEAARPIFRELRWLRDELSRRYPQAPWSHLSMGMTNDFEVAIQEGATLVRIGRAIFGERP